VDGADITPGAPSKLLSLTCICASEEYESWGGENGVRPEGYGRLNGVRCGSSGA